jgi:hypothetical protein
MLKRRRLQPRQETQETIRADLFSLKKYYQSTGPTFKLICCAAFPVLTSEKNGVHPCDGIRRKVLDGQLVRSGADVVSTADVIELVLVAADAVGK